MDKKKVKKRISEFAGIYELSKNDPAALLEAAFFVEDVFGIALSDEEICEENLGTCPLIELFVIHKLQPQMSVNKTKNLS